MDSVVLSKSAVGVLIKILITNFEVSKSGWPN
jgi:hypothetical protein